MNVNTERSPLVGRLAKFLEFRRINIKAFEVSVGASNASIGSILKRGWGSIGSDRLTNILTVYPDLSAEWLLRGEGAMLRSAGAAPSVGENGNCLATAENASAVATSAPASSTSEELLTLYREQLRAKDDQIKQLLGLLANQK